MQTSIPLLQSVRVASPCEASWEGMEAVDGERVKFCLHCAKNVYNLSEMTQGEAEGLLRKYEGKLCVRYYQRRDGTVLTRDCPIGAQAVRMGLIRRSTVAASLFAMLFGAMAAMTLSETNTTGVMASAPKPIPVAGGVSFTPVPPTLPVAPHPMTQIMGAVMPMRTMGEMVAPPPPRPMMGKMRVPEHKTKTVAPVANPSHEGNTTSADTSDEAILKPRR